MAHLPFDVTGSFKGFALCVVRNDNVLLPGGILNGQCTRDAHLLNTITNKWDQLPHFRTARSNHASFSTSKAAFVCCGDYSGYKTEEIEELEFDQQLESNL